VGQTESLDTVASNDPTLPDRDGVDNDGWVWSSGEIITGRKKQVGYSEIWHGISAALDTISSTTNCSYNFFMHVFTQTKTMREVFYYAKIQYK
jgi:hypothetical protein